MLSHCMCGCIYEEADCPNCNKITEADRIEELEAKLADAIRIGKDWLEEQKRAHVRAVSAESKLAKLARAAKPFAAIKIKDGMSQPGEIGRTDVTNLRTALAELKGQDDE